MSSATVIGAGVIGLCVARELLRAGRHVTILEAGPAAGLATSGRNSGVVHAGLYYAAHTAKSSMAIAGNAALYRYCRDRAVPFLTSGKLLVATSDAEHAKLGAIVKNGVTNGVPGLQFLSGEDCRAMEPALSPFVVGGALSPSSGVVDVPSLLSCLRADIDALHGKIEYNTKLVGARVRSRGGTELLVRKGSDPNTTTALKPSLEVVNSAGLWAHRVAAAMNAPPVSVPPLHLARGCYFRLLKPSPFQRLIYPMPSGGGLGVHLTMNVDRTAARFGPDIEYLPNAKPPEGLEGRDFEELYSVDGGRKLAFLAAIKRYWSDVDEDDLVSDFASIRPKLVGEGASSSGGDFVFSGSSSHGQKGVMHLYGMESPGLTACFPIAERVRELLDADR